MMKRKTIIRTMLMVLLTSNIMTAIAQHQRKYTEEDPLVIVCDWEFPPYEFVNDAGRPDGYNIELLDQIFKRLNIPYRYLMQEWYQATASFENHEADLIHALSSVYQEPEYVMTQNLIHYYRITAVRRPSERPLTHISQLGPKDTIIVKTNDYVPLRILQENPNPVFQMAYHSPKDGLAGVHNGTYKYFLWGERPIKWKIKEFGLDSLVVEETDIPAGELRLIGYDKELINMIDDEFARMEQSGEVEKIRNKWFYPERVRNDSSPVALIVIGGFLIVGIVVFLLSRLIRSRVRAAVRRSVDLNSIMKQAVSIGDYYVIEHDFATGLVRNVYGKLLPEEGLTGTETLQRIHPDEQDAFFKRFKTLKQTGQKTPLNVRWNMGTTEKPDWHFIRGNSIVEYTGKKTQRIVNCVKDVTNEMEEERKNSEMGEKFRKIFDTNMVPMSLYDANGQLLDLNEEMRQLCNFNEKGEKFFTQVSLFDMPTFRDDIDWDSLDMVHACQHLQYSDIGIDKYIVFRVRAIKDEQDCLIYYLVTARDITAERSMYLEQRQHDLEMHKVADNAQAYETQLRYLLENSNMYVWQFDMKDKDLTIKFSRSLKTVGFSMSRKEYLQGLDEGEHQDAERNLMEVMMKGKEFNTIHYFKYTPANPEPCWYILSGLPVITDGHVTGYFGIARNVTELMEAQQKLKEETARAEDSGRLKSVFLANMTHEIRTPLNAIVGFSDLLQEVETKEERMEFIRIIRNNCDMLLRLINDILEASSMGQALPINPKDVDFATAFDDICQTLAQRVTEPGVEFIKENPYTTFPTRLDIGRVQQVVTNFLTNAVKYTQEGHIKLGYRYEDGGLYIYCEDTGAGIPEDKQASVFERFVKLNDFVQGTGLGLSICKSIVIRCNGRIGVDSKGEGSGSTFWFWIPCKKYADQ